MCKAWATQNEHAHFVWEEHHVYKCKLLTGSSSISSHFDWLNIAKVLCCQLLMLSWKSRLSYQLSVNWFEYKMPEHDLVGLDLSYKTCSSF